LFSTYWTLGIGHVTFDSLYAISYLLLQTVFRKDAHTVSHNT